MSDIPAPPIYSVCEITDSHVNTTLQVKGVLNYTDGFYVLSPLFTCDMYTPEILVLPSERSCGMQEYLRDLKDSHGEREAHVVIYGEIHFASSSRYTYELPDACFAEFKVV